MAVLVPGPEHCHYALSGDEGGRRVMGTATTPGSPTLLLAQVFPTTPSLTTPSSMFASNAPKWQKQRPPPAKCPESCSESSPSSGIFPGNDVRKQHCTAGCQAPLGMGRKGRGLGGLSLGGTGPGPRPDLITYSTLLKGYCQARGSQKS